MGKKGNAPKKQVHEVVVRPRHQSRRAASKEALKQMQILLEDENDTVEIPDDDDEVIPIPVVVSPPKKKYKLTHRKSSDGHDREVLVLKSITPSITNHYVENNLELECWVEELEPCQKEYNKKLQEEEKALQSKLDELVKACKGEVVYKGELTTVIEVSEHVQKTIQAVQASANKQPNIILNNAIPNPQAGYQLIMDPRLGLVVGTMQPSPQTPAKQLGKVQVAQNLQSPVTPVSQAQGRGSRGRKPKQPPVLPQTPPTTPARSVLNMKQTNKRAVLPPPQVVGPPATRSRGNDHTPSLPATRGRDNTPSVPATRGRDITPSIPATRGRDNTPSVPATRGRDNTPSVPVTRGRDNVPSVPATRGRDNSASVPATRGRDNTPTVPVTRGRDNTPTAPTTRARQPATANIRPTESNVEGGLAAGSNIKPKAIVDLTGDDGKPLPDSREISFNKLQGKTFPSLVVVARPHLRVQDVNSDRSKLDSKVKSVLMYAPTKFTEWLIQQGLVKSEQKCSIHAHTQLKLGMYSDVSKFPYSGGYVWISECCPQRFVSVFSGSIFEGSPHPPLVILKLLYHWACQTNIQNVTQWVKVDNLYVKGMYTWLRSVCSVALQTHVRQLGGPQTKVEVGVISLGTTSQDGNSRQVKVEVLGILETTTKLIRLRAVEPLADGDRNYKKRFSKILEPLSQWVHPQSVIVTDLTVDKATLHQIGFAHVLQTTSVDATNSNRTIMEYLRRIVPRMFQNTLSLLSRQIIQQFLDELVWREWFGTTSMQAFDNLVIHLAEQTRFESTQSLILRLNKVALNPFKNWAIPPTANVAPIAAGNSSSAPPPATAATVAAAAKTAESKKRKRKEPETPKPPPQAAPEISRPPKSISPDVPEQMVPLENYYYGTIDNYPPKTNITLNMKCPFCKDMFNNNIVLMSHLFKHAHNVAQDGQMCRYCLTSVPTANDLLKHIASSHPSETKHDNGFVCLICETQYMNPFVLGKHMSKEHCPSELPYQCGTCGYRCSNHKQAIDHFYKQHDNGPTIQCPFCLKSTTVFSSSRNIVQNMNYFIQHLQKHQRKQYARRCGKCNLWFVQKDVLKDHQTKMHASQRGKTGLVPWTAPRTGVMVPKSKMDKYPCDAETINFTTLTFNLSKNLKCKECNGLMESPKHFPSFESCQNPNCQYSTCCSNAMQEHNAKCKKDTQIAIPVEKLPFEMFCICGHSSLDGNQMAKHLATCERKSAYPSTTEAKGASVTHSMLDVLGLVRKPEETDKSKLAKPKLETDTITLEDDDDAPPAKVPKLEKETPKKLQSKTTDEVTKVAEVDTSSKSADEVMEVSENQPSSTLTENTDKTAEKHDEIAATTDETAAITDETAEKEASSKEATSDSAENSEAVEENKKITDDESPEKKEEKQVEDQEAPAETENSLNPPITTEEESQLENSETNKETELIESEKSLPEEVESSNITENEELEKPEGNDSNPVEQEESSVDMTETDSVGPKNDNQEEDVTNDMDKEDTGNENKESQSVDSDEPQVLDNKEPQSVTSEEPQIVDNEEPQSVNSDEPQMVDNDEPQSVNRDEHQIIDNEELQSVNSAEPEIVDNEDPESVNSDVPEPLTVGNEETQPLEKEELLEKEEHVEGNLSSIEENSQPIAEDSQDDIAPIEKETELDSFIQPVESSSIEKEAAEEVEENSKEETLQEREETSVENVNDESKVIEEEDLSNKERIEGISTDEDLNEVNKGVCEENAAKDLESSSATAIGEGISEEQAVSEIFKSSDTNVSEYSNVAPDFSTDFDSCENMDMGNLYETPFSDTQPPESMDYEDIPAVEPDSVALMDTD